MGLLIERDGEEVRLYTQRDIAFETSVSTTTVHDLIARGVLPSPNFKLGFRKLYTRAAYLKAVSIMRQRQEDK